MSNKDQINEIRGIIQDQLGDFNSPPVPTHTHNGWDANRLNPAISLTGFPVYFVADASVAPTDQSENGSFRFLVDFNGGAAHFRLWAYLVYLNATNVQVAKWVSVALS